jgi:hypothetical protein
MSLSLLIWLGYNSGKQFNSNVGVNLQIGIATPSAPTEVVKVQPEPIVVPMAMPMTNGNMSSHASHAAPQYGHGEAAAINHSEEGQPPRYGSL